VPLERVADAAVEPLARHAGALLDDVGGLMGGGVKPRRERD